MLTIAPQYTQIEYKWTEWKAIAAKKQLIHQSHETDDMITVWGYDGPEVHFCYIYKNEVPECVVIMGYSQAQNDIDKADYEMNFKDSTNASIIQKMDGEFTPKTIKNEHNIEPWGAEKGHIIPSQHCCEITLSNKQADGLTFNYNETIRLTPEVGQYVFQKNNTVRSWITEVNVETRTVKFDLPVLDNGDGFYRKGYNIFCKIRDYKPLMYLWGVFLKVKNAHDDDFLELNIIDKDGLFNIDEFCAAAFGKYGVTTAEEAIPYIEAFGFEKLGEFEQYCKYYDESWVINMNGREVKTPDGAPGTLLPNLYLLIVYYPAATDDAPIDVFHDYLPTSKD